MKHSYPAAVLVSALAVSTAVFISTVAFPTNAGTSAGGQAEVRGGSIQLHPRIAAPAYQVRLVGPNGAVSETLYMANEPIILTPGQMKGGWGNGSFTYEITPVRGVAVRGASQAGNAAAQALAQSETGSFRIQGGRVFVSTSAVEQPTHASAMADEGPVADQVIPDDLIVQGSSCVGLDCVDGESFGFDTIRLKENNTRIAFDDTSSSAGFPANDWQLLANDSASGGLSKFSLEDVTGAKTPWTVVAGAPTNSFYLASTGNVGFGTSTPSLDLHMNTSDTPAIRFEQNNSGGFSAQTWDIGANEANFFIRDLTGGSKLSFRIRPGAPTSSIDIAGSGNVGIGTSSPSTALDVARTGTDSIVRLSNLNSTGITTDWDLRNNVASGRFNVTDDATGVRVPFKIAPSADNNLLRVGVAAANTVDINGNLIVTGTITPDYVFKKGFKIPSIREHADFMWKNSHLPKMAPAQTNARGQGVINVGQRAQGMLEELEYAHVYIEQLHGDVQKLQKDVDSRDAELDQLRREIAQIKADLARQ